APLPPPRRGQHSADSRVPPPLNPLPSPIRSLRAVAGPPPGSKVSVLDPCWGTGAEAAHRKEGARRRRAGARVVPRRRPAPVTAAGALVPPLVPVTRPSRVRWAQPFVAPVHLDLQMDPVAQERPHHR